MGFSRVVQCVSSNGGPGNCILSHTYIYTHTYIPTYIRTCMYVHTYTHMYAYTYIHTYIKRHILLMPTVNFTSIFKNGPLIPKLIEHIH